jgi:hypothetical protein
MKKINELFFTTFVISMILFLTNCKKDNNGSATTIQNVIGYAQKGPFINGSSITVYDLQSNLSPSGKSFNAQITDNKGTFELSDISLSSNYISLRADGFYFNEISGQQSAAQITLYALSDITGKSDININILTHLEKSRVEYLMKNGKSFADSKIQAQKEILAIFNIEKSNIKTSENLNISQSGDDNGILLAISSILQGYRSESELTDLLSNISNDIKADGTLDSDTLGSTLISHAIYLDTTSIRSNLTKIYSDIGSTSSIPNFGKYISNFMTKTKFKIKPSIILYPAAGKYGDNVLPLSDTIFNSGQNNMYSLSAQLSKGTALKIKIIPNIDSITQLFPIDTVTYFYPFAPIQFDNLSNWQNYIDFSTNTWTFIAIESGKISDLGIYFAKGRYLIEYYEMNLSNPIRKKLITVK